MTPPLRLVILAMALAAAGWRTANAADRHPNVVFILADDLGIGDVHCYGGERCQIDTPHIDALAAGGLRFTDAHVNASVCGPTRLAIMTGRYPWRFGARTGSGPWGFVGPRKGAERMTLGKLFREAGYRTGYVGKWHLGTVMTTTDGGIQGPTNVDYTKPLTFGPPQFGFDDSFILPGSLDMYPYAFARHNVWQGNITAQKGWSAFNRVGPAEEHFEDHEVLDTFYRESETFIERQEQERPFFLYLALTAPHTPTSPGLEWRGKSSLGVYGDFVMEVDHAVERVRGALQGLGVEENTLILISSDHGAASYAGNILKATPGQMRDLEKQGHYANSPHRGYKFSAYEGGLRVPLIAHWPAVIEPGEACDALVGLNDFMATFAELVGVELPADVAPDSISFAALLREPQRAGDRRQLILQSALECFVVRDGNWKLCLCPGSGARGIYGNVPSQDDAWRSVLADFDGPLNEAALTGPPFVQLFNLVDDLHEDRNLAAQHPGRVEAMVALLKQQIEAGRSTPGPALANDRPNIRLHQRLPEFVRERLESPKPE